MQKDELINKAKTLLEFFEDKDSGYYPDRGSSKMFEVNVKRHSDYVDVNDLIEKMPRRYWKALKEELTEDHLNNVYESWLSDERDYFMDVIKSRGSVIAMTPESWKNHAGDLIEAGKETPWLAINELKTLQAKRKQLQKFIDNDAAILDIFSIVDVTTRRDYREMGPKKWLHPENQEDRKMIKAILKLEGLHLDDVQEYKNALAGVKTGYGEKKCSIFGSYKIMKTWTETSAGLYGRSGGHFCFDISDDPTDDLGHVVDWCNDDGTMTEEEAGEIIKRAGDIQRKIAGLKACIESFNKSLSWSMELQNEIENKISDLKQAEKERRTERVELARKSKMQQVRSLTLGQLLESKNPQVKELATGILKLI